jgi:hypothetical protein
VGEISAAVGDAFAGVVACAGDNLNVLGGNVLTGFLAVVPKNGKSQAKPTPRTNKETPNNSLVNWGFFILYPHSPA